MVEAIKAALRRLETARPPGRRRDQRRRARRRPRDRARRQPPDRASTTARSRSACPRSRSACCPAAAASPARSACSASSRRADERAAPGHRASSRPQALEKGLVDELVADPRRAAARPPRRGCSSTATTRTRRRTRGTATGYRIPGGTPTTPEAGGSSCRPSRRTCASRPRARPTRAAGDHVAPRSRAPRSTSTPPRGSSRATSTNLVVNQQSKNMIQAFFFDLQAINAGVAAPEGIRAVHGAPRSASSAPG